MKKRAGKLIDTAAKEILYNLSKEKRSRQVVRLSNEISAQIGLSWTAVLRRIEALVEDGLLSENYSGSMRLISITEKGQKAVKILKELDKVMEE